MTPMIKHMDALLDAMTRAKGKYREFIAVDDAIKVAWHYRKHVEWNRRELDGYREARRKHAA